MICARLSLSQQPEVTEDVAGRRVYCLPYQGNVVALPGYAPETLPDAGLSVDVAALPLNSLHDLFLAKRAGVTVLASAPMGQTPPPSGGLVLASGTPLGGLTYNGGLGASFDGSTAQGYAVSSRSAAGVAGYSFASAIGLQLATAQAVKRIEAWSPVDNSFIGSNDQCAWQIRAGATVETAAVVASGVAPAGVASTIAADIPSGPTGQTWWLVLCGNGINGVYCTELRLYVEGQDQPATGGGIGMAAGLPVNDAALSLACDAGSFTVQAGQALYMGSLGIGPSGIPRIDVTYKPDVRCDLWNYWHPLPILLQAGDNRPLVNGSRIYHPLHSPSGYNFGTEGREDIRVSLVSGIKRRSARPHWRGAYFLDSTLAPAAVWTGIGLDGSTTPAGTWSLHNLDDNKSQQGLIGATASCTVQPFEGFKTIRPLEGRRGDVKGFWQEPNQVLTVDWEC